MMGVEFLTKIGEGQESQKLYLTTFASHLDLETNNMFSHSPPNQPVYHFQVKAEFALVQ